MGRCERSLAELEALMDLCNRKAISYFYQHNESVEIRFHGKIESNAPQVEVASEISAELERMPTEDEMLLYSTPAFDDVREARKQAILPPK